MPSFRGPFLFLLLSLLAVSARGANPDFSGKWVLDPTRSQDTGGVAIELSIKEFAGKIVYKRTVRERDGKQDKSSFKCAPVGTWCKFNENGHKAKVSLWYDGPVLMMAKTGGPSKDATTERRLELSPDSKTLTVEFTNFSGSGKPQKLMFRKQE